MRPRRICSSGPKAAWLAAALFAAIARSGMSNLEAATNGLSVRRAVAEPGADIFATNAPVLRFRIEIAERDIRSLRNEPRTPVPATVREGDRVFTNVAAHLKGAAGSFRQVDDNPALTLSFGRFASDQRFHGLRKIHLNNSVQDPSYSTEYICGHMFHLSGVPAPRVAFARVWLNGRDLGFYVLKEGFTADFLGRYFARTKGNLYDGGFLKDVTDTLEKDQGDDEEGQKDLKALAAAAMESNPAKRWERLNKTLDVERFVSFMAMEVMVWDWDGYVINRNNYRIYHDPTTDRMVFLPHGMDQMFWEANGSIHPGFRGLVADGFIQTAEGSRLYRRRLAELFRDVYQLEPLTNLVKQLRARNRPAIAEISPGAARAYDEAVEVVRDRIVERWSGIKRQLDAEPEPLKFTDGAARLAGWRERNEPATARLDRSRDGDRSLLHIAAAGNCTASWRARVLLDGGRYRFEGLARGAGIVPFGGGEPGEGAGLRISGMQRSGADKLAGDSTWTRLGFEFDVSPPSNFVELVCELRATRGEVWFDADSLRLVRLK